MMFWKKKDQWEYKWASADVSRPRELAAYIEGMNVLGMDGWEAVSAVTDGHRRSVLFKRRIK